ncbi:hypothetical protein [Streptomyces sp. JJ66]|uniref:hypothetical protein n=1 Tax=Streptomyces sp. JJ66 TaxID=2803843 RepID=UPI001C574874|nr:hypothetical protein [Streptomyces sp. JJ66]
MELTTEGVPVGTTESEVTLSAPAFVCPECVRPDEATTHTVTAPVDQPTGTTSTGVVRMAPGQEPSPCPYACDICKKKGRQ